MDDINAKYIAASAILPAWLVLTGKADIAEEW